MTFSMCLVKSASRCSMWAESVQMRLATNCSSKSARCMKAEKFSPSPTGSMIVKRTLAGGMALRSRSIALCISSTALARPGPPAFSSKSEWRGKGQGDGEGELGLGGPQPLVLRHAPLDLGQLHLPIAQGDRGGDGRRRRPAVPRRAAPVGKRLPARLLRLVGRAAELLDARTPAVGHAAPLPLEALPALFQGVTWRASILCGLRGEALVHLRGAREDTSPRSAGASRPATPPTRPAASDSCRRPAASRARGGVGSARWRRRAPGRPSASGPCAGR